MEVSTEERIREAAEIEFLNEGFAGARMQAIADRAGINKALLHYYFRSKDKLFELVFAYKMSQFVPKAMAFIHDPNASVLEKLEHFVEVYIHFLRQNPSIPLFISSAMNRNPDLANQINMEVPQALITLMRSEILVGKIKKVDETQFMISVIGMCLMPFFNKPMLKRMFSMNDGEYQQFLQERPRHIQTYMRSVLEL